MNFEFRDNALLILMHLLPVEAGVHFLQLFDNRLDSLLRPQLGLAAYRLLEGGIARVTFAVRQQFCRRLLAAAERK